MSNFPHAHSLDGVEAASWERGYYTRHRTDLPYPPIEVSWLRKVEQDLLDLFTKLGGPSRRMDPPL